LERAPIKIYGREDIDNGEMGMNDDDKPSEDVFDEEDSDDEAGPGSVSDI
jgi:hypothetical protein